MPQLLRELFFYLLALAIGVGIAALQYSLLKPLMARGPVQAFLGRVVIACSGLVIGTAVFFGAGGAEHHGDPIGRTEALTLSLVLGVLYALLWPLAPYLRGRRS